MAELPTVLGGLAAASVTDARAAGRTSPDCATESAEAGSDRGAAPGIARNRADQRAPGRAPSRTL